MLTVVFARDQKKREAKRVKEQAEGLIEANKSAGNPWVDNPRHIASWVHPRRRLFDLACETPLPSAAPIPESLRSMTTSFGN
ncbi:uncharacterized protein UV8b_05117 [Ustilaginoidea virens]|uniref:Uncharacterized protein n=1 Tax=Ustilaginoidea virens TaxID=1159556 RepID=A0A8E5HSS4_USTVR|nr:uncharacterized protein UV8b_05117 [Ustilaginoidea virens]QUC20876.1 hypothetical protein UV8b_05117 [Ustilaginoidea virens]